MAPFISDFSTCALCGELLPDDIDGDDIVGTTHFIGDPDSPLYPYSDSLMHRNCFLKWEYRIAFVAAYNLSEMRDVHYMRPDGVIRERFLFWFPIAIMEVLSRCFRQSSDKIK